MDVDGIEPFATVEDLQGRWRDLTPSEQAKAVQLLSDASLWLSTVAAAAAADTSKAGLLRIVSCDMVIRKMSPPPEMVGLAAYQQSAGPYQVSQSLANPAGDFYLTRQEERLLGIGGTRIGAIKPKIGGGNDAA
jgi:hypothetical protein